MVYDELRFTRFKTAGLTDRNIRVLVYEEDRRQTIIIVDEHSELFELT